MSEQWLPVVGFEGWYQVSSLGRVRRIKICQGARPRYILTNHLKKIGYYQVDLWRNNSGHDVYIHRLVAMAFLGLPQKGQIVNHKNGNKLDNRLENLEWVTQSENELHRFHVLGLGLGEKNSNAKLKNADIPIIRQLIKEATLSLTEIGRKFGVSEMAIWSIKTGRCWSHIK